MSVIDDFEQLMKDQIRRNQNDQIEKMFQQETRFTQAYDPIRQKVKYGAHGSDGSHYSFDKDREQHAEWMNEIDAFRTRGRYSHPNPDWLDAALYAAYAKNSREYTGSKGPSDKEFAKVEVLPASSEQVAKGNQWMWKTNTPQQLVVHLEIMLTRLGRETFEGQYQMPPLPCLNCKHLKGDAFPKLSTKCGLGHNMEVYTSNPCPYQAILDYGKEHADAKI